MMKVVIVGMCKYLKASKIYIYNTPTTKSFHTAS